MQNVADDWFWLISSSPSLSEEEKKKVERLRRSETAYRLSTSRPAGSPISKSPILGRSGTGHASNSVNLVDSASQVVWAEGLGGLRSGTEASRSPINLQVDMALLRNPVDDSNDVPATFSVRLRDGALKGAFHLIATPETSYTKLIDKFGNCIFINTRDEIKNRLALLIQMAADPGNPYCQYPAQKYAIVGEPHSSTGPVRMGEEDCHGKEENYLDPVDIHNYLASKGLTLKVKGPYAEFSSVPASPNPSGRTTIFDEVRRSQKIRVNVNRLQHGKACWVPLQINALSW
jgi:hypothetical protein